MVSLKIKWNKQSYDDFVIEPQEGVAHLKQKIYELTGVPADRQKLMAKGAWIGTLKDDAGSTGTSNVLPYKDLIERLSFLIICWLF